MGSTEEVWGSSWAAVVSPERDHSGGTGAAAVQLGGELRLLLCSSYGFLAVCERWGSEGEAVRGSREGVARGSSSGAVGD